jgi:2,3-bisphosphoglycerate-dependent phosphoglycerate mutase
MTAIPATELIIIRHGETEWNLVGRMQGHSDSDLTALGRRQAEAVAARLACERLDALYASDLGRAMKTAAALARTTGLPVVPDTRLRERNMGIFQGLTHDQMRQRFPQDSEQFASRRPNYVIPDGESMQQCHDRVVAGLQAIADRHIGGRVAVVTHGGPLSMVFRHTMGLLVNAPRRWSLFNASINRFHVREATWQLGTWGDLTHLAGLVSKDDR